MRGKHCGRGAAPSIGVAWLAAAGGAFWAGCGEAAHNQAAATGGTVAVHVTAPLAGTTVSTDNVTVRGTVDPPTASVQVDGNPAAVGNGVFTGYVHLQPGPNSVDVIGSASGSAPGSIVIPVTDQASSQPHVQPTKTVTVPVPQHESPSVTSTGTWPGATSAWTVVLASAGTQREADQTVARAAAAGLPEAGVLLSSEHRSLRPGYWVAFSGVLSHEAALARQQQARGSGFSDAYARFVSAE